MYVTCVLVQQLSHPLSSTELSSVFIDKKCDGTKTKNKYTANFLPTSSQRCPDHLHLHLPSVWRRLQCLPQIRLQYVHKQLLQNTKLCSEAAKTTHYVLLVRNTFGEQNSTATTLLPFRTAVPYVGTKYLNYE